ncbi:YrhK family protein [Actinomycetospora sp. TBRC 11914]|uniref:YrhK family protein n=1 Tax=Actinomycetospora sp. TBRC 11914 TaxID=2729387 RepID=UPI00145E3691|nr:YrhK family protein [Actinomycetospora sp. TBRC 11914]NMO93755.1 hypothetical protein [Actinomycetospora sp. TBRC 11914]
MLWLYLRYIARHAHDLPWVHLVVGAFGNAAFVVGSIFFLYPSLTRTGTWLFVVASWGMLIGVTGEIAVRYEARRRARGEAVTPPGPTTTPTTPTTPAS